MKKTALILCLTLLCAVFLFSFSSCSQNDPKSNLKKAQFDPEMKVGSADFTLFVPESFDTKLWTSTVCASGDKLSVSVIGSDISGYTACKDEWKAKEENLKLAFADYNFISEEETEVAHCIAVRENYTATVAGTPLCFSQYYFIKSPSLYVMTFSYKSEDAQIVEDDIKAIVSAFSFDKKAEAPENMKAAILSGESFAKPSGCTLYIDKNWTVSLSAGVLSCRLADSYKVNITLMSAQTDAASAEEYFERNLPALKESLVDFELVEDECGNDILAGEKAHKYVYTAKALFHDNSGENDENENAKIYYKFCQYICVKDGSAYILTYTGDYNAQDQVGSNYYEEYFDIFSDAVANFEFSD